jgi:hypothetical protein
MRGLAFLGFPCCLGVIYEQGDEGIVRGEVASLSAGPERGVFGWIVKMCKPDTDV